MYQPFDTAASDSCSRIRIDWSAASMVTFRFDEPADDVVSPMVGRNSSDALAHHDCCNAMDADLFEDGYADAMEGTDEFDDIEDVFDYLEDNFAQPLKLRPPGDCTWSRHGLLQRHVRSACDRPRSCEGRIGCGVLRKRGIRNAQCTNARGRSTGNAIGAVIPSIEARKEPPRERPMNAAGCFERGLAGEDNFSIRPVA